VKEPGFSERSEKNPDVKNMYAGVRGNEVERQGEVLLMAEAVPKKGHRS
jgi:hypothetical protein